MFKLLRLAIYAIVGYAAYHFITDVVNASGEREESSSQRGGRRGAGQARGARSGGGAARMSGTKRGGGGKAEVTADADGASTRHRVGRGVV